MPDKTINEFYHPPKLSAAVRNLMTAEAAVDFCKLMSAHEIQIWIDGGWGVDALLGRQTRQHEDLDIVVQQKDVPKLRNILEAKGYKDIPRDDTGAWNFVLGDDAGHAIDIHVIIFDGEKNGLYGPVEKGMTYPAASLLGTGAINGYPVKCIAAEYVVKFHTGYKLQESDYRDVSALCERFNIDLPVEYADSRNLKVSPAEIE